uniref:40S ribosomal protein S6 n=1 Tax=Trepomonas sp. PC1 TaxID=1076344 RepID=A0A146K8Q1_9EUKA|eukprot:JAP93242.1 Ribosomal protein S6 [Trepomonas sp. PC1]
MPKGSFCKVNVHYPATGGSKSYTIDDFRKSQTVHNLRIAQEVDGAFIDESLAGCQFKITGGNDSQGFPMMQGVLKNHRVRLILKKGSKCFRQRREGQPKRKSVRGCIVAPDLHALNLVLVNPNGKELPGLTDADVPKRHVPKRARKIRRLFGIPDKLDPKKLDIVKKAYYSAFARKITRKNGKTVTRCPKIRRLVTDEKFARKHRKVEALRKVKVAHAKQVETYLAKVAQENSKKAQKK